MLKINKVVKNGMKPNTNMFFQSIASFIGNINFDRNVSVNELIAFYVKKSTLLKMEDDTDEIGNAYLSVAILLAFIERLSTPFKKLSSVNAILSNENFNTEDMIAECTGILAKSMFEGNEEHADESLASMAELVKKLLQEEEDDCSEFDESDEPDTLLESEEAKLAELSRKVNDEPVSKE